MAGWEIIEIVTVNYDPLLEKAFDEEGLNPTVIHSAATYRQLTEQSAFVIKIHGCPFKDNDPNHLVMMKEELSEPPPWVITFLQGRLPERIFIYVGFSGNAEYVRNCIRTISAQLNGNINEAFGIDNARQQRCSVQATPWVSFTKSLVFHKPNRIRTVLTVFSAKCRIEFSVKLYRTS